MRLLDICICEVRYDEAKKSFPRLGSLPYEAEDLPAKSLVEFHSPRKESMQLPKKVQSPFYNQELDAKRKRSIEDSPQPKSKPKHSNRSVSSLQIDDPKDVMMVIKKARELALDIARKKAKTRLQSLGITDKLELLGDFSTPPARLDPFELYFQELQESEKTKQPEVALSDIRAHLLERWKQLPNPVLEVYENKATRFDEALNNAYKEGSEAYHDLLGLNADNKESR